MEYDDETELTRYVWNHLTRFLTGFERLVGKAILGREKAATSTHGIMKAMLSEQWGRVNDVEVNLALADGVEVFRQRVCARVLRDHENEININRCPKCNRVVRTPNARQCFWCGHDWHETAG